MSASVFVCVAMKIKMSKRRTGKNILNVAIGDHVKRFALQWLINENQEPFSGELKHS